MTADLFFDSSALSKHYRPEVGTSKVDGLLAAPGVRVHISRLTRVEMHSVFAKKVRVRQTSPTGFRQLVRRFRSDLHANRYAVARMTVAHHDAAERLLLRLAVASSLRSLDALQLAVALDLNRPGQPVTFVSADQALCGFAAGEGLTVINPEVP